MPNQPTRRSFLKAALAAAAAPVFIPARALGKDGYVAPSERITFGMIGTGDHGIGRNVNMLLQLKDAQILAACDVDRSHRERAKGIIDRHYSAALGNAGGYKACDMYNDFRELLARPDIDAVQVSTPDHWHILASVFALRAGKDVICEKPLTVTIAEGRLLANEVKRYGKVFQTSSENRSVPTYRRICELVRNGRIGKLQRIFVGLPSHWGVRKASTEIAKPPEGFDYDFWLGPAPLAPYCESRCHWNFRWINDYSGGQITDWGAHLIDIAQWGHDTELTGPVAVEGTGTIPAHPVFNTFAEFNVNCTFADGVVLNISNANPWIRFEGTGGWVESKGWRAPMKAEPASLVNEVIGPNETHLYYAPEDGEHRNFIDCVKSRRDCYGPAEVGHRTISIAHLGHIAMRLGRKLKWDPEKELFVGDEGANRMLTRAMREPWRI